MVNQKNKITLNPSIPMAKDFLSIQEASDISRKSVQTIRRAVKAKKLICRRQKTPQGFNYLVSMKSLSELYGVKIQKEEVKAEETSVHNVISSEKHSKKSENISINTADFKSFAVTLEKMISQHSEERQNFLRLMNTMQEKIYFLETQLNLLKAPSKKWYQLWK